MPHQRERATRPDDRANCISMQRSFSRSPSGATLGLPTIRHPQAASQAIVRILCFFKLECVPNPARLLCDKQYLYVLK